MPRLCKRHSRALSRVGASICLGPAFQLCALLSGSRSRSPSLSLARCDGFGKLLTELDGLVVLF